MGPGDTLVEGETGGGPVLRHIHMGSGAAGVDADKRPLRLVDYWLERPDGRGLVEVSFSTPHLDVAELTTLTDTTVLAGAWVVEDLPWPEGQPGPGLVGVAGSAGPASD